MYCGRRNDTTADLTMARAGGVGIQHEEGAPQSNITLLTYRNTLLTHTQAHSQIHRFESLHPSIHHHPQQGQRRRIVRKGAVVQAWHMTGGSDGAFGF